MIGIVNINRRQTAVIQTILCSLHNKYNLELRNTTYTEHYI